MLICSVSSFLLLCGRKRPRAPETGERGERIAHVFQPRHDALHLQVLHDVLFICTPCTKAALPRMAFATWNASAICSFGDAFLHARVRVRVDAVRAPHRSGDGKVDERLPRVVNAPSAKTLAVVGHVSRSHSWERPPHAVSGELSQVIGVVIRFPSHDPFSNGGAQPRPNLPNEHAAWRGSGGVFAVFCDR